MGNSLNLGVLPLQRSDLGCGPARGARKYFEVFYRDYTRQSTIACTTHAHTALSIIVRCVYPVNIDSLFLSLSCITRVAPHCGQHTHSLSLALSSPSPVSRAFAKDGTLQIRFMQTKHETHLVVSHLYINETEREVRCEGEESVRLPRGAPSGRCGGSHSAGMPCLLTAKLNKAPSTAAPEPTLRKPTGVSVRRRSTCEMKPPLLVTLSSVASTVKSSCKCMAVPDPVPEASGEASAEARA